MAYGKKYGGPQGTCYPLFKFNLSRDKIKISHDKWKTCQVPRDRLSRMLFPWKRRQWLQQLESSFLVYKFTNLQSNQRDQIIHTCSQSMTTISEKVSKDFVKSRFTVLIHRAVCRKKYCKVSLNDLFTKIKRTVDLKTYLLNCGSLCRPRKQRA